MYIEIFKVIQSWLVGHIIETDGKKEKPYFSRLFTFYIILSKDVFEGFCNEIYYVSKWDFGHGAKDFLLLR